LSRVNTTVYKNDLLFWKLPVPGGPVVPASIA